MCRIAVMAILLLATVASSQLQIQVISNPCSHHTCPADEQCVVQEVNCLSPPCPLIGECVSISCTRSCPLGHECRHLYVGGERRQQCVRHTDPCQGRCHDDEECVSHVQPCTQPPCLVRDVCEPRSQFQRARQVPTKTSSEEEEEELSPRSRHLSIGHDLETAGSDLVPVAAQPKCLVECAEFEECRSVAQRRCSRPPCPQLARCVPRQLHPCQTTSCASGQRCVEVACNDDDGCARCVPLDVQVSVGGRVQPYCPVDDLSRLAAGCPQRLDTCTTDRRCGEGRKCCARGCGKACVPSCGGACRPGEECRLVRVACIRAPCAKVPQCASIASSATPAASAPPPRASSVDASFQRPPRPQHSVPVLPESMAVPDMVPVALAPPARPMLGSALPGLCGNSRCSADQVCRPEWCAREEGCHRHQSASATSTRMRCVPRRPQRPGTCPVNEGATVICFQRPERDQCVSDYDCQSGSRCCIHRCAKRCVRACQNCLDDEMCRLIAARSPEPFCHPAPIPLKHL